ncbi:hypothetical protein AX15_007481 [Amanita polypyramis BW_CC]|nr:hypothetical protein AX15_007481 [Amanita polypyramis BW_CC]
MAPTQSSGNTRSSLRQGTLSFASTKRTALTSTAGKQRKAVVVSPSPSSDDATSTSVVEDSDELPKSFRSHKRVKDDQTSRPTKRRHVSPSPEVALKPLSHGTEEERPRLNPKDKRWIKIHAAAKRKMEYPTPIHSKNQNKIHEILRVFDLSYEYGPCVGMTRLERWERACALGLNPPEEIREILTTVEGMEKTEFLQCAFHGDV